MKIFTFFTLAFMTLLSAQVAQAQCNANFTQSGSDPTFTFSFNSAPAPTSMYYWDFGDGTGSGMLSPTHTYLSNGTFTVTASINDSVLLCSDLQTMQVVVTNASSPTCDAQFIYSDSNGITYFVAQNPFAGATYSWTFGDGTTSNIQNPAHTYASPGSYQACLTISDPLGGCSDTWCDSIILGGGAICDASFGYNVNYNTVSFSPVNFNPAVSGSWDFGDGSTATGIIYTSHTYSATGVYNVCFTVSDTAGGCTDTFCDSVHIDSMFVPQLVIQGSVVFNGLNPADSGVVFLIEFDSLQGTLTAIDTVDIGQLGTFSFINVPVTGSYLVKAALSPASAYYTQYMPTYFATPISGNFGGELLWNNASFVTVLTPPLGIELIAGNNPGGPGFVSGLVSQGANKTDGVGDPMSDITVLLLDANGDAVSYAYSDDQGLFSFPDIALGTYTIYPDVYGKTTNHLNVVLTATDPTISNVKVEVNTATVDVSIATGIAPAPEFAEVSLYPNPVNDVLNIDFGGAPSGTVTIEIMDVTGRVIKRLNADNTNTTRINTADIKSGIYLLRIRNLNGEAVYKFIK